MDVEADGPLGRVNRVLLGLAGVTALCGGGWAAVVGLQRRGTFGGRFDGMAAPDTVLDGAVPGWLRPSGQSGGWAPGLVTVLALALALVALLCWLTVQRAPAQPRVLSLPGPGLSLRTRALSRAVAAEAAAEPDVSRARVRLRRPGRGGVVRVRVLVTLAPHAEPGPVLERLCRGALDGLSAGVGHRPVRCTVRLRTRATRASRVR